MEKTIYSREYDLFLQLLRDTREQKGLTPIATWALEKVRSEFAIYGRNDMYRDRVEFRNRLYNLRLVDFGEGWGNYFVASAQLLDLLLNEDQSYTYEDARYVDELIFYFVPAHYFKLSDDELRDKILEEIG